MIYLQASRYFALVMELLCDYEVTIVLKMGKLVETIGFDVRRRLHINQTTRIPWNTKLNEGERDQFYRLCDWIDQAVGKEIQRLPLATIASVNMMLSHLRDKFERSRITIVQLEFFKGASEIHKQLLISGINNGLVNTEKNVYFPLEADQMLAAFIDKMDALGICLG